MVKMDNSVVASVEIDAIVVTYNRLEKLKKALSCYDNQTMPFRNLIVVDNCSTDGTSEYLEKWKTIVSPKYKKIVVHNSENLGGSGGFAVGERLALELSPDWLIVADDDAYVDRDLILNFRNYLKKHNTESIDVITTAVLNPDKSICVAHRLRHTNITKTGIGYTVIDESNYDHAEFPVSLFSYVGPIFKFETLKKFGIINADYFIYNDDTEHSLRILLGGGKVICVPSLLITHDGNHLTTEADDVVVSWHHYYEIRNFSRILITHFPMSVFNQFYIMFRKYVKYFIYRNPYELVYANAVRDAVFGIMGKNKNYPTRWCIKKK